MFEIPTMSVWRQFERVGGENEKKPQLFGTGEKKEEETNREKGDLRLREDFVQILLRQIGFGDVLLPPSPFPSKGTGRSRGTNMLHND